jgi:hypothetical protein
MIWGADRAVVEGQPPSEYVVPVPPPRHVSQGDLELDAESGERRANDYVNELRAKVGAWRALSEGAQARSVRPVTAALLRQ